MSLETPLADQPLGSFLRPAEQALLRRADLRLPEALHGYLRAAPSLEAQGVRRQLLMQLLVPRLSPHYAEASADAGATDRRVAFGALLREGVRWPDRLPPNPPSAGALGSIDLLDGLPARRWIVRKQAGAPDCVAQAVAACLELARARHTGNFEWLSTRFLDEQLRALRGEAGGDGAGVPPGTAKSKLSEAAIALAKKGICRNASWDSEIHAALRTPPPAVFGEAEGNKWQAVFYLDRPPSVPRMPDLARRIHAELAHGRAVAIALPAFRDRDLTTGPVDWDRDSVWFTGQIPDPDLAIEAAVSNAGHAVCVVGFQASAAEPLGGYFVFRNSWDTEFGKQADLGAPSTIPPSVPLAGYGVISASHVERHCWECASFAS